MRRARPRFTEAGLQPNSSGTPSALLESLRQGERVIALDNVTEDKVLIEFPFTEEWQAATGARRFIRLRKAIDGYYYALVK